MPYITQRDRELIAANFNTKHIKMDSPGELNYIISILCQEYVKRNELTYSTVNEVMGVLSSAQAEFYRRVVAPYEDKKIGENGDVYNKICEV